MARDELVLSRSDSDAPGSRELKRLSSHEQGELETLLENWWRISGSIRPGKPLMSQHVKASFDLRDVISDELKVAVIVGQVNPNLLGQARALGRCGIPVYALLARGELPSVAQSSRFIQKVFDVRDGSNEVLINSMREIARERTTKPILFFAGDFDVDRIAGIWSEVCELCIPITAPAEASELGGKNEQFRVLDNSGINLPKNREVNSTAALEEALEDLAFPVIARPVGHLNRGSFPGKVVVADDAKELIRILAPVWEKGVVDIVVQEYIPGDTESVNFALAHCSEYGEVKAVLTGHKCLENPMGRTNVGISSFDQEVAEHAATAFRTFGLGGVLGIEFKRDRRDQRLIYIETNFRPDNFVAIAETSGMNLLLAAYLDVMGYPELYKPLPQRDVIWWDYSLLLRKTGLSVLTGKRQLPRVPVVDAFWCKDDVVPGFLRYLHKCLSVFKALPLFRGRR